MSRSQDANANEQKQTISKMETIETMSNNKQSSIELFIEQLEEKGGAWENVSIRRVQISIDVSEYMELKTKAKAMHKEEMVEFSQEVFRNRYNQVYQSLGNIADDIYNETFENNNEQK